MINFLHNFNPNPIILDLGIVQLNWYGFFISLGILVALLISLSLGIKRGIKKEEILDISFWLIIFGVLGARLYDVLLEIPFYIKNPFQIIKIWQGGLAIHGAIIAGVLTIFFISKKNNLNFWKISAIFAPGLALAQAIGRIGNYFNQELFGKATSLPWGIPIALENRPLELINETHFHPTFIYESLGCLLIFFILLKINQTKAKSLKDSIVSYDYLVVALYMLLYSMLRFSLEFIRVDYSPVILGFKVPQITSLLMAALAVFIIVNKYVFQKKEKI